MLLEAYHKFGQPYNVKIKYKSESFWMKYVLRFVLFFVRGFMMRYTTTIFKTIYFPSREVVDKWEDMYTRVFLHEMIHVLDRLKYNRKYFKSAFTLMYLSPQIFVVLSLLSLFAVWNIWFLLFLSFLVLLLPWPSRGRALLECRAYSMSARLLSVGFDHDNIPETSGTGVIIMNSDYANQLTSAPYYWCCWNKNKVRKVLSNYYLTIQNEDGRFEEMINWYETKRIEIESHKTPETEA